VSEAQLFAQDDAFRGLKNVGSGRLARERLPSLLASLIKCNAPGLTQQVREKTHEANIVLLRLGAESESPASVRTRLHRHAATKSIELDTALSTLLYVMADQLSGMRGEKLTKEFVAAKMTAPSLFAPPFFQGRNAFDACVHDIATLWWAPVLDKFEKDTMQTFQGFGGSVFDKFDSNRATSDVHLCACGSPMSRRCPAHFIMPSTRKPGVCPSMPRLTII
jgi:hypothetical protein